MMKPVRLPPDDFALTRGKALAVTVAPGTADALAAVSGIAGPRSREPAGPAGSPWTACPAGREPDPPGSLPIRSAERRRWAADLATPAIAGLVLCGVGGIGKSTLAAQIASRMSQLEPARVTAVFSGGVSVNQLLAGVSAALRRHPAVAASSDRAAAARAAERTDLPWAHRLTMLREQVLRHVPVLVVLDNFDDSVLAHSGGRNVRDPALAELIAGWARATHQGKLLITCRHPFSQPAAAALPLRFRHVGPLSRSGAFELAKSLPALGRLGEPELDRAWRLLGGHPLAMKYLDSLLATREISFPEVTRRIAYAIGADGGSQWPTGPAAPTELPPAGAETIMVAAGDLLLGELLDHLSAGAQDVLIRASAHGGLTGPGIVTLPGGQEGQDAYPVPLVAECAAAGLLTTGPPTTGPPTTGPPTTGPPTTGRGEPGSMWVHPWTAEQILRLAEERRSGEAPRGTPVHTARRRPARGWPSRRMTAVVAAAAAALASTAIGVLVAQRPGPGTTGPGAPPRTAAASNRQAAAPMSGPSTQSINTTSLAGKRPGSIRERKLPVSPAVPFQVQPT